MPAITFIPIDKLDAKALGSQDYVVYGGTFDPIHAGHLSVVKTLAKCFQRIIIAPTSGNPWKSEQPTALTLRQQMIEIALRYEAIPMVQTFGAPGVSLYDKGYTYAEDVVNTLRACLGNTLYWAVGADSAETVAQWRNWETLAVPMIVMPIEFAIHSTDVRTSGKGVHPGLVEFVKRHGLYDGKTKEWLKT